MPLDQHSRTNRRHAIILVLSLIAIVSSCGVILAGPFGLLLAFIAVAFVVASTSRPVAGAVMRMYRAQPLSGHNAPDLVQLFTALCQRARLAKLPRLYYIPSKTMNAFAIGHGEEASVAITAGLLQRLNPREIAGVLAHEISHITHNDVFVMSLADGLSRITAAMGQAGQIMILLSLPALFMGYNFPWLAAIVLLFAPGASALLQLALSRSREYNADVGAVRITGDPLGLASALARLETSQGSWFDRVMLPGRRDTQPAVLRTHPHTSERIERLNEMAGNVRASTLPHPEAYSPSVQHPPLRPPRWRALGLWY